jgi:lysophospholipase L1-like esterase
MKSLSFVFCFAIVAAAALAHAQETKDKLQLRDGDRIVLVGSTLIEREQVAGYVETMLVTRFPNLNLTFRNLGYSGDTVSGEARGLCTGWSTFESPEQGFNRLRKLVQEIRPTVLIVSYGMNESFSGPAKLADFVSGYNQMLDKLIAAAKTGDSPNAGVRQIVLLSPNYHEDLGRPLPDPSEHNANLKQYSRAISDVAAKHGAMFIDLYAITEEAAKSGPLTSSGIHLNSYGYWRTALALEKAWGLVPPPWQVSINGGTASGTRVSDVRVTPESIAFRATDVSLPAPPPPDDAPKEILDGSTVIPEQSRTLQIFGLKPGVWSLKAEDRVLARGTAEQWAKGVQSEGRPLRDRVEQLRKLVAEKNFDFFNYWRPENDSYILSFRKHEQGKNAAELPQFKPQAETKEAEIAKLRVPQPVVYTLVRENEK